MSSWDSPPKPVRLATDEVHVWAASLELTATAVDDLWRTLTDDERQRAQRFCFSKDRSHFIAARGALRAILGRYLAIEPAAVRFSYSEYGKPALTTASGGDALRFNVSHSHGLALYAVTQGREIGIDIELIRSNSVVDEVAARFFSKRENEVLRALSHELRVEAFFNCWTRKEAYIKARGEGLSLPLDQFDVSLTPGEPAVLLSTRPDPNEASRWSLDSLNPAAGYVAALAVEGNGGRLKCWRWLA